MKNQIRVTLYLITIFIPLLVSTSFAQEWTQTFIPDGNVDFLSVNPHDTTVVYASKESGFWVSQDCGQTFEAGIIELPAGMIRLKDIIYHPTDPATMIFCELHDLYLTNDSGQNWELIDQSAISGVMFNLISLPEDESMICFDISDAGNYSYIQYSPDFGQSWSIVDSIYTPYAINLVMNYNHTNSDHIVAAESYSDSVRIIESFDRGLNWTTTRNQLSYFLDLEGIYVDPQDDDHILLTGTDMIWEPVFTHSYSANDSLIIENMYPNRKIIFHENAEGSLFISNGNTIHVSNNAALTDNIIDTFFPNNSSREPGMFDLLKCASNPQNVNSMFVSNSHGMFYSDNQLYDYTIVGEGISHANVYGIKQHNNSIYIDTYKNGLWKFNNETSCWNNITPHYTLNFDVTGLDESIIYAGGCYFLRSLDGGENFTPFYQPGIVFDLAAFDTVVVVNGDAGVSRSFDYGNSWEDIGQYEKFFCSDATGQDILYFCDHQTFKRSYDYGDNWELLNFSHYFIDMVFTENESVFYASDSDLNVYYTTDSGDTFENITGNLPTYAYSSRQMVIQPGNFDQRLFIPVYNGVYYTENHDGVWTRVEGDYSGEITGLTFSEDGTDIFISTKYGGVWIGEDIFNDIDDAEPDNLPQTFGINKVYPNPFNSTTRITYTLEKASEIKILVYNIQGQLVATLFNGRQEAGQNQIIWDGHTDGSIAKIASGIYYLSLITHNQQSVQKIVLIQ